MLLPISLYERIRLLKVKGKEPYSSFYKILGFYPKNISVYEQAFAHKSSPKGIENGRLGNNERLEFLGDAVLNTVIADILFNHFQNRKEGFLTNTRSKIVSREMMNNIAQQIGLDKLVTYSSRNNSHTLNVYGNALEALIGAVYLDQGYKVCFEFIRKNIVDKYIDLEDIARKEVNFKSNLLEWGQKNKFDISFQLIEEFIDKDGNPVFQTAIYLFEQQIGVGIGFSKKESQQHAAQMAINKLRTDAEFQRYICQLKKEKRVNPADTETSAVETKKETVASEVEILPAEGDSHADSL